MFRARVNESRLGIDVECGQVWSYLKLRMLVFTPYRWCSSCQQSVVPIAARPLHGDVARCGAEVPTLAREARTEKLRAARFVSGKPYCSPKGHYIYLASGRTATRISAGLLESALPGFAISSLIAVSSKTNRDN